jgi:hypothetical protein
MGVVPVGFEDVPGLLDAQLVLTCEGGHDCFSFLVLLDGPRHVISEFLQVLLSHVFAGACPGPKLMEVEVSSYYLHGAELIFDVLDFVPGFLLDVVQIHHFVFVCDVEKVTEKSLVSALADHGLEVVQIDGSRSMGFDSRWCEFNFVAESFN